MIYDKLANRYEKAIAPLEKWFLNRWRAEAISLLPTDARILEIGAGTGLNFKHYPDTDNSVATDISIGMLGIAASRETKIRLVQADAEALPFTDESFDSALATLVFCSISEPHKAFDELRRVLKNNSRIILLEHVRPKGLLGWVFDVLNIFTVALMDDHFNRNTAQLARESGLTIVEVRSKAYGIFNLLVCENKN